MRKAILFALALCLLVVFVTSAEACHRRRAARGGQQMAVGTYMPMGYGYGYEAGYGTCGYGGYYGGYYSPFYTTTVPYTTGQAGQTGQQQYEPGSVWRADENGVLRPFSPHTTPSKRR